MSKAKKGDTVKVEYVGTMENGEVFDQTEGGETLDFTIGDEEMIPGFETAVIGMAVGETKSVTLDPEDAYGEWEEDAVATVPRDSLPEDVEPAVGVSLEAEDEDGLPFEVVITEITDKTVTVDGNHPLAGKKLSFKITLKEIVK
jgi:peptidylprolyl isomerase